MYDNVTALLFIGVKVPINKAHMLHFKGGAGSNETLIWGDHIYFGVSIRAKDMDAESPEYEDLVAGVSHITSPQPQLKDYKVSGHLLLVPDSA